MDISGLFGSLPVNPYERDVKRRDLQKGEEFSLKPDGRNFAGNSANSAGMEIVTGKTVSNAMTANTLWQAQSYAQSRESDSIDVESETVSEKPKSDADKFLDFMSKTPEELMREAILKELGYTEEQLASMGPEERAKAEAEIEEHIETKVEQAMREDGIDIDGANKVSKSSMPLLIA